jgi:hypothetical protein
MFNFNFNFNFNLANNLLHFFGFSDILFASILLLAIYIYLNLKNIVNEQLNFNHMLISTNYDEAQQ